MTEEVSSVAAEWCLSDVEGEDVEIGRRGCFVGVGFDVAGVECFRGEFAVEGGEVEVDAEALDDDKGFGAEV
jgi:hypothetical protein